MLAADFKDFSNFLNFVICQVCKSKVNVKKYFKKVKYIVNKQEIKYFCIDRPE